MSIGYCNHTTCLRSGNLDLIERAISSILEQEGYHFIPQPALPKNDLPVMQVLRSLHGKVTPYLGMVGLFPGNLGWTFVKTQPAELLCQRARGAVKPRLAELAIQSRCDGFHYRIYDDDCGALLETDASGQIFVSGYCDGYDFKDMKLYDEQITKLSAGLHFFLLDVPEEIRTISRDFRNPETIQIRKEELSILMLQERPDRAEALVEYLAEWEELDKNCFQIDDETLGRMLVGPDRYRDYWYQHNLYYKAYTKQQQLEADRVRFLYFQSAKAAKKVAVKGIWETICEEVHTSPLSPDDIPF